MKFKIPILDTFFEIRKQRKEVASLYNVYLNRQARAIHRPAFFLGIFVWLHFAFYTDSFLHPEFGELFYFRIGFSLLSLILFVLTFFKKLRGKGFGLLYVYGIYLVSSCSFFTGRIADDPNYVSGLQLVIIIMTFGPVPLRHLYGIFALSIVLFTTSVAIYGPSLNTVEAYYSMNNLIITYVVVLVLTPVLDSLRFNNFYRGIKLKESRDEEAKAKDALWGEMALAKKIQTVLLPERTEIEGHEVTACMEPASLVGGDYYDIINSPPGDWVAVGDVSGHGVPAGLIMMMVQTSISLYTANFEEEYSPSKVLAGINRTIYDNIKKLDQDRYMTILLMLHKGDGEFVFSGLHEDILVYRAEIDAVESIETDGAWIGIMESIGGDLGDSIVRLERGDVMLLYTDGITEAWKKGTVRNERDPDSDMFGIEKLKEILQRNAFTSVENVKEKILHALDEYQKNDDITMVIIKRT